VVNGSCVPNARRNVANDKTQANTILIWPAEMLHHELSGYLSSPPVGVMPTKTDYKLSYFALKTAPSLPVAYATHQGGLVLAQT
jgi:hypothetical protein